MSARTIRFTLLSVAFLANGIAFSTSVMADQFPQGNIPGSSEDGGYRYFEVTPSGGGLNMRMQPSIAAAVVARLDSGIVLTNLGCKASDDNRVWCDVQPVSGGSRGYVDADYLRPAIGPDGTSPQGPENSALRTGQADFDATGRISCTFDTEQPMSQCDFGVARAGGRDATIIVTRPDNRTRVIFFTLGYPSAVDTSQADNGLFSFSRSNDLWRITIGKERYEIPDAAVLGG